MNNQILGFGGLFGQKKDGTRECMSRIETGVLPYRRVGEAIFCCASVMNDTRIEIGHYTKCLIG
jgi:hypothetical protein